MANIYNDERATLLSGTEGSDTIQGGGYWNGSYHSDGSLVTQDAGKGD